MKVLWFANTPSNFAIAGSPYNGGGWVSALENEMKDKVDLAVAFVTRSPLEEVTRSSVHSNPGGKVSWASEKQHGVTYYPVSNGYDHTRRDRAATLMTGSDKQTFDLVESFISIVEDFSPDIIQVFGSEHSFGLVAQYVDIPVILHIQGLVNPYFEAFLPPGATWNKWVYDSLSPARVMHKMYTRSRWIDACKRETQILRSVKYYLGRTRWDHEQVRKVNPEAVIFEGGEIMRQPFYDADIDAISDIPASLKLVTTISEPTYKGFDLVLKTAKLLRDKYSLDFEWKVFGNVDPGFFERITGITVQQAGVTLAGVATARELVNAIAQASMYVHPSYIDNSPNGVCEAQLLGAAVVATNVGGVPSLISDGETGFLVRKGNAEEMAERIVAMYRNRDLLRKVGHNARRVALQRHDRQAIASSLMDTYRSLL